MRYRYFILAAVLLAAVVLSAGCTGGPGPATVTPSPGTTPATSATTTVPAVTPYTPPAKITTSSELLEFVMNAAAFARQNGREKAVAAFNDPNGSYVLGRTHVFAIMYDGTIIADPTEPEIVGTNIMNMTDFFGTPLVENLGKTARSGRGYVSYSYPNPAENNEFEPQIAAVEDVDGTYFVAAGLFASEGEVYPSTALNTSGTHPGVDDLVGFVKEAVAYGRSNGKEKAIAAFNDPKGRFVRGELVLLASDYNGTILASPPYSPELTKYHVNLINYHDPDRVDTIRTMRDISREGGGFSYTVAKVKVNGKEVYVPKINYAEPVDGDWWIFSGVIVPEYTRIAAGNLTGIQVRNHTREELYGLVNLAVEWAAVNGKEKALAEINNPAGKFVKGDLFAWAESTDGTLLADPFWKSGIGRNQMDYTDRYGMKVTRVGIGAMTNGTGFSHALFPNTALNGTADVPK
ncbi:MAG: cache domain-containing protein, partial [Methanoregulaceae archaeon]|nr:cache domain-containing protein [Methanoregulaceae archaeon]